MLYTITLTYTCISFSLFQIFIISEYCHPPKAVNSLFPFHFSLTADQPSTPQESYPNSSLHPTTRNILYQSATVIQAENARGNSSGNLLATFCRVRVSSYVPLTTIRKRIPPFAGVISSRRTRDCPVARVEGTDYRLVRCGILVSPGNRRIYRVLPPCELLYDRYALSRNPLREVSRLSGAT